MSTAVSTRPLPTWDLDGELLRCSGKSLGSLDTVEAAYEVGVSPSATRRHFDGLERRALVERTAAGGCSRIAWSLTPAGREVVA